MEQGIYSKSTNSSWINSRGTWSTHLLIIVLLKLLFWSIPNISSEASWTLTNVAYNLGSFVMFHWITGMPFESYQPDFDGLTLWEQMDNGAQFTPTKKFLTATPIVLFLISSHYTNYDVATFFINFMALVIALIGKLPAMHRVRIFGINEGNTEEYQTSTTATGNGKRSGKAGNKKNNANPYGLRSELLRRKRDSVSSNNSFGSEETLQ